MKLPKIETYNDITIVRDDIPFPFPSPNFSKIRGIEEHVKKIVSPNICILDTIMSRCGWGLSYVCRNLDKQVYNFYSRRKQGIDFYRKMSESFGAKTIPIMGTHQKIAKIFAEKWLKEQKINDYQFLPLGLAVQEKIDAHVDLVSKLPSHIFEGSLVCCVSSGTIFSGLLKGIRKLGYNTELYGVQAHSWKNREDTIKSKVKISRTRSLLGENVSYRGWQIIDLGYNYLDQVKESPPFPCDRYLDRKAWQFVERFSKKLKRPITFWNIGGEWSPDHGLEGNLRGDGTVTPEQIKEYFERII